MVFQENLRDKENAEKLMRMCGLNEVRLSMGFR